LVEGRIEGRSVSFNPSTIVLTKAKAFGFEGRMKARY
jgi:hypothetical protein